MESGTSPDKIENYCLECSKGTLGCEDCCTSPFRGLDPGFWLTLSDVTRIVKKTNLHPDDFCRFTKVTEEDEEDGGDIDEIYGEYMCVGDDKVILMNPKVFGTSSTCKFLGANGCKIFRDRPKMCRIYPFWFKEEERDIIITIDHEEQWEDDDCLITKTHYGSQNMKELLSCMNDTEDGMKLLVREYIGEMKLHHKYKLQLQEKPILDVLIDNGFLAEQYRSLRPKNKIGLPVIK